MSSLRQRTSPWSMKREELVRELRELQVPVHPNWTVPELRATLIEQRPGQTPTREQHALKGISKMSLEELKIKAVEADLEMPPKVTRGWLIKALRDNLQPEGDQVMTFGKYKSWMFKEVPFSYQEWAMKETEVNTNSSPELVHFAAWCRQELAERKQRAKGKGVPTMVEDPEVNAKIPPPAMSESAWSVLTWKSTESGTTMIPAAKRAAKQKRDMETIDVESMDAQVPAEVAEQIAQLEAQAAILLREHRLPSGGTPSK